MEITPKAMELTPQAWEIEHKRKKTLNVYGHVLFAGDDTLHLFRLVPMLVANLSAFFMIACNLQVGRIFMGIRISVLQRSENVRVDKGRVENMKKKKPGPFGGERTGLYNQFVNHL